ncbi:MAG: PspC domain-containing protein [Vicinamibacterales bacterium]
MTDDLDFTRWPTSWVRIMAILIALFFGLIVLAYWPMQQTGATAGRDYGGEPPAQHQIP